MRNFLLDAISGHFVRKPNIKDDPLPKLEAALALQGLVDSLRDSLQRERDISEAHRLRAEKYERLYLESLKMRPLEDTEIVGGRSRAETLRLRLEKKYRDEADRLMEESKAQEAKS